MIPYRFLPAAEQELDDTVAHYERERDGLSNDFFDDLTETIEKVRRLPRVGTRVVSLSQALEVRSYILGRFPYKLIGVLHSDALTFIALAHQHQAPDYWRPRLKNVRPWLANAYRDAETP